MSRLIFMKVAGILTILAKKTKVTYKEINIIVYFFIIPFSYLVLLDVLFQFHYLKIAFLVFTAGFFIGC